MALEELEIKTLISSINYESEKIKNYNDQIIEYFDEVNERIEEILEGTNFEYNSTIPGIHVVCNDFGIEKIEKYNGSTSEITDREFKLRIAKKLPELLKSLYDYIQKERKDQKEVLQILALINTNK